MTTATTTNICAVCDHADRTGSWVDAPGQEGLTHCRLCHGSWSRTSELQHCTGCCRTFTTAGAADIHRRPLIDDGGRRTGCREPSECVDRRGRPQLVESAKRRRSGTTVDVWGRPGKRPASTIGGT